MSLARIFDRYEQMRNKKILTKKELSYLCDCVNLRLSIIQEIFILVK